MDVERDSWQLVQGDGANMAEVRDGEAALVLTSPPYFDTETEALLRAPRRQQTELETVREQVVRFALSLRPVFEEAFRVTRPGGVLVVQTKDLRYGDHLVTLAAVHQELAESAGFRLATRVFWQRTHDARRHGTRRQLLAWARRGEFRARDVEEFQVFRRPGQVPILEETTELPDEELEAAISPLWRLPGPGPGFHPYASPAAVLRRFVLLFTRPGDLVVDPFAGQGTTLRVAAKLGRRSIGYEIERRYVEHGEALLERDSSGTRDEDSD
jgi:modification methylase